MLSVTQDFKDALTAPIKRVRGYIVLQDGSEVTAGDDLVKYTITSTGEYLKTAMSELKATLRGEQPLKGTMIDVYYGTYYDDDYQYVRKGKFNITEAKFNKNTNTTELTGYDNMLHFAVEYTPVGEYPTTLYGYLTAVCSGAGVSLENDTIYNGAVTIEEDYYQNVQDYTFRDVLEDICEVAGSYAVINPNGNVELRQITDTGETLTYDNLLTFETGEQHGGVNSLVLSRQPQNDDVFIQNEADITRPTTRNILDLNKFNVGYSQGGA